MTEPEVKRNPLITPPRETTVVLHPGDVESRLDALDEQIEAALADERTVTGRMAGGGGRTGTAEADRLAAEKDKVVRAARDESVTIRLRQIGNRLYDQLLDDHQPREKDAQDQQLGYNRDGFPPALIRACLVDPEVTDEEFDEWFETLSPGRFARVFAAAHGVTIGDVELPKSSAVSVLTRVRLQSLRPRSSTE